MDFFSTLFLSLLLIISPRMAEELEAKNEHLEAAKMWQELIDEDPDNPFYYFKLGRNFYSLRAYDHAEAALLHALSMDPKNPDFLVMLAFTYLRMDKYEKSIALFEQALAIYPNYTGAKEGLVQAKKELALREISVENENQIFDKITQLEAEEQLEEVLKIWQELVEKEPNNYFYLYELGRAYARLERYGPAIESFKKSLRLDPGNTDVISSLGYAYLNDNQYDLAEESFHRALTIYPQNTDAQEGLKRVRNRHSRKDESSLVHRAIELEAQGKVEEAIAAWERVIQLDPDNPTYLYRLGRLLLQEGQMARAERYLKHALELDPNHSEALATLDSLHEAKKEVTAERKAEIAQKKKPTVPDAVIEAPAVDEELAQVEPKKELSLESSNQEELVQVAPQSERNLEEEAATLEKEEKFQEAIVLWEELAIKNPSEAYIHYKIGTLYVKLRQDRKAQKALAKARLLDPSNPDVAVALGYVYLRQGKERRAWQLFEEVLESVPNYTDAKEGLVAIEKREAARQEPARQKRQQLYDAAVALEQNKLYAEAAEKWQALLQLDPDNFYALYRLGRFYYSANRLDIAELYLRHSLELSPDNVDTKLILGFLLIAKGELAEARTLFQEVLAAVPTYEDANQGLAQIEKIERANKPKPPRFTDLQQEEMKRALCYEKSKDYDNAAVIWEELYCKYEDDLFFVYQLGRIYSLQRKYQKALPYLEEAVKSEEESEKAQFRLASNYSALGWRCQAHALFEELTSKNPENGDYLEALARSHRSLNHFSDSMDLYTQRFTLGEPHYSLFSQKHATSKWTNPFTNGFMLYAQERETDIVTRVLSAQRNTSLGQGSYTWPVCDKLRLSGSIQSSVVREMNLVVGLNNLFMKQQDYAMSFVWLLHPSFSVVSNFDYQVGRDIGVPIFPIGHRYRFLPALFFNYSTPAHLAQFTMQYDTLLIKDFTSSPSKGNLLKRLTLLVQDEQLWFHRNLKVGVEAFYRYYEGDPFNRQWQAALYSQVGFPKYNPCFFLRYWGQAGGFLTNLTNYYSFKRQWQHSAFIYFSKQAPLNMQIDVAFEQAWQWNRQLNQPVNTAIFINKLFRSYERLYFEVHHLYRPHTEFHIKTTSYWDSTKYTAWDVKGSLTHVF